MLCTLLTFSSLFTTEGCFKLSVLSGVGLEVDGFLRDDAGLDGGGLVGDGFRRPGCFKEGDGLVDDCFSAWLDDGAGGGGLDTEGALSPDGCLREEPGGFIPDSFPGLGVEEAGAASFDGKGDEAPLGGIPLLDPGLRKPLIREAPVEGGIILD